MSQYEGNSAVFPLSVTIPDDGSKRRALEVAAGMQGLADRTARLNLIKGNLGSLNAWLGNNGFQGEVYFTGNVVEFGAGTMLRTPPVVDLVDTPSQIVGPEDGWYFRINSSFASTYIVRLRDTGTPALQGGETVEIFFDGVGTEGVNQWSVRRETNGGGSANILTFNNDDYSPDAGATWARFQFKAGTGWIFAGGSGCIVPGAHFRS
jgi:hypothetical protein